MSKRSRYGKARRHADAHKPEGITTRPHVLSDCIGGSEIVVGPPPLNPLHTEREMKRTKHRPLGEPGL